MELEISKLYTHEKETSKEAFSCSLVAVENGVSLCLRLTYCCNAALAEIYPKNNAPTRTLTLQFDGVDCAIASISS